MLICNVLEKGRLTWVIQPSNIIVFALSESSSLVTQTDSTGQFTASLIHYSRDQQYSFLGNLTSTLQTQVNPALTNYPVSILCHDGFEYSSPSNITIAGKSL